MTLCEQRDRSAGYLSDVLRGRGRLEFGDRDKSVQKFQEALNGFFIDAGIVDTRTMKIMHLAEDGNFGRETYKAVSLFQARNSAYAKNGIKLQQSGCIDKATAEALLDAASQRVDYLKTEISSSANIYKHTNPWVLNERLELPAAKPACDGVGKASGDSGSFQNAQAASPTGNTNVAVAFPPVLKEGEKPAEARLSSAWIQEKLRSLEQGASGVPGAALAKAGAAVGYAGTEIRNAGEQLGPQDAGFVQKSAAVPLKAVGGTTKGFGEILRGIGEALAPRRWVNIRASSADD